MSDVTERLVDELAALVRRGSLAEFSRLASELEPADLADVLAALDDDERVAAVQVLPAEVSGQALIEMPETEHPEDTLASLDAAQAADIVEELADDDAADILGELEPADQERILAAVEDADRADVEKLLIYHEETAGGLMTSHVVAVLDTATGWQRMLAVQGESFPGDSTALWVRRDWWTRHERSGSKSP